MTSSRLTDLRAARHARVGEVARAHARAMARDRAAHAAQVEQVLAKLTQDIAQALEDPGFQQQLRQASARSQREGYGLVSACLRRLIAPARDLHAQYATQGATPVAVKARFLVHAGLAGQLEHAAENRARACPGPDQANDDQAWARFMDYATTALVKPQHLADILSRATEQAAQAQAQADVAPRPGLGGLLDRLTGQADGVGRRPISATR